MKAFTRDQYGSPEVLEFADIEMPVVADDGVLVRVQASSVNQTDLDYLYGIPAIARLGTGLRVPTLARYLRLLGFDTAYARSASDRQLIRTSTTEGRILLTRDVGLLKNRAVTHGHFVRSDDPRQQVLDVVSRFQLAGRLRPYSRCLACNGVLESVAKEAIAHRLPPLTRQYIDEFRTCLECGKDYWRGAHAEALDRIVAAAQGT